MALAGIAFLAVLRSTERRVRPSAPASPKRPPEETDAVVTVARARLTATAKAEKDAGKSEILERGTRVLIAKRQSGWCEVVAASGARGWLPCEQIEGVEERERRRERRTKMLALPALPVTLKAAATVRLGPGRIYPVHGDLPRGTRLEAVSILHGWYAVKLAGDEAGFVPGDVVDPTEESLKAPARGGGPEAAAPSGSPENAAALGVGAVPSDAVSPPPRIVAGEDRAADRRVYEILPPGAAPARILERSDPEYSPVARRMGVEGVVVLRVTIEPDGRAGRVDVTQGLPLGLSEAAVRAVRRWRFEPARVDGEPVAVKESVSFRFVLR